MTVCHVCGTENQPGTTYCEGCGVELSGAGITQTPPAPGASPEPERREVLPPSTPAVVGPPDDAPVRPDLDGAGPASLEPTLDSDPVGAGEAAEPSAPEGVPPDLAGSIGEPLPPLGDFEPPAPEAGTAAPERPAGGGPGAAGARLEPKRGGGATSLVGTRATVGRFDPSTGPVDVDLSSLPGAEHISRRHAELFVENGRWVVRDLGSTNGVYVKRAGEQDYGARLQAPYALADGDEVAFGNVQFVYREGSATA